VADRLGVYGNDPDNPPNPRWGGMSGGLGRVQKRKGSTPIYGRHQELETPDDLKDLAKQDRLFNESLSPNMAGERDVALRAKQAVDLTINSVFNSMAYMRNKWLSLYRLFRGESLAQFSYGRVPLHSPEPFKAVETMHPRLWKALFGMEPWFLIHGQEFRDDIPAKLQTALCRAQMVDMEYETTARMLFREFMIYGTCVQKTYWRRQIRKVQYRYAQRIPNPDYPGTSKLDLRDVEREEYEFDGNDAQPVSIFDFWAPLTSNGINSMEWCADRSLVPDYQVRQRGEAGEWLNLDELEHVPGDEVQTFRDEFKERKNLSYGVSDSRQASTAPHVGHRECVDWYGPLRLDGKSEVMCQVTVLDPRQKRCVAVVREIPFWHGEKPYQLGRFIELAEETFGIGLLEAGARLSMELDAKKMLYHAAVQLESNPMLVVGASANVHDSQLIAIPGLVLRAETSDDIKPLVMPRVSESALAAMDNLVKDYRETTGITAPVMGESNSRTATQDTNDLNESNLRINGAVKSFEIGIIKPMLNQMCWNNQQFMTRERVLNVIGPLGLRYQDRYEIKPEQITGRFIYVPMASVQLAQRNVQTQQLINLLDRAPAVNQLTGQETIKIPALLARIFRDGYGFHDVASFITVPPSEAGVLTPTEEHEMWYHGEVPPVKEMDNQLRHIIGHMKEIETEAFQQLEKKKPSIGNKARAHIANHMLEAEKLGLMQEQVLMAAAQMGAVQNAATGGGGEDGGAGFSGAGQKPGSPGFRGSSGPESGMPRNENGATKSEAGMNAPNAGAS